MNNYSLTVITVVKNDEKNIEKTIKSVIKQKKINIEYIIIDGSSKDQTLNIIKKYRTRIDKIISEKDNGIYYAMNKGIKLSKNDIIVFCNSGDFFYPNSLKKILDLFNKFDYDFVFGTVLRNYTTSSILKFGFDLKRLKYNFDFATSHTTGFFLKRKIYKKIGFYNTYFKISSDYDLYLRLFKNNCKGGYTKKRDLIGYVAKGGFSSKVSFLNHAIEEFKIRIYNKQNLIYSTIIFLNSLIKNLIKSLKN
tara:strand:- start:3956 stop:4705 length:750 start_codon:yes stop_codon:yes gene_type:complete